MVDSGATGNFINPRTVQTFQIPTERKTIIYQLETIDGTPIRSGVVDLETVDLVLTSEHHSEVIRLDVTDIGDNEIVLGMPWLRHHNPQVDWRKLTLSMSRRAVAAVSAPKHPEPENQVVPSQLQEEYHDFLDVFNEKQAKTLPPHRSYDHHIELDPAAPPPYTPMYSLSPR